MYDKGVVFMQHRSTFTIEEENFSFLKSVAGNNRSAYINSLLEEKKKALLKEAILKANKEEAETDYQESLSDWDITLSDGLHE
jgi:hypothetical protein